MGIMSTPAANVVPEHDQNPRAVGSPAGAVGTMSRLEGVRRWLGGALSPEQHVLEIGDTLRYVIANMKQIDGRRTQNPDGDARGPSASTSSASWIRMTRQWTRISQNSPDPTRRCRHA